MPTRLLVHAVNQVHGSLRVVSLELRLNPDGEELRTQVALPDFVEIDMAFCDRRVLAQIKVFVEEALWRVRVRVHARDARAAGGGLSDAAGVA